MRLFSALALFSLAGIEQVTAQQHPDISVGRRGILPRAAISTIYRVRNSDEYFTYSDNCSCPSNGGGAAGSTGNANPGNAGIVSSNAGQGVVSPVAGQAASAASQGTTSQQGSAANAATPVQLVPASLPVLTFLGVTAPGNLVSIQGSISVQGLPNQPQTIVVYVGLFINLTVRVTGQATSTITQTTTSTVTTTVSAPTTGTNTGGAGVLPISQTSATASTLSGGAGVQPVMSSSSRGLFLNSTSSSTSSGGSASALPVQGTSTSSPSLVLSSTSSCPISTSVSTSTVTLTALPITTTGIVATLNRTSTLATATDVFTIQVTTTTTITVSLGPLTTSTVLLDPTNTVDITQSSVSSTSTVGPFSTTTTTTNTDTTTTTLASTGIIATVTQNVNFCTYQDASCPVVGTSIAFFGYVDHTASVTSLVSATVSAGFVCASAAFTNVAGVPQNPAPNQRKTCYLASATAQMRKRQAVATIAGCTVSSSVSVVTEFITPTVTIIPTTTLISIASPRISGSTTSSTGTTTTETSYSSSTSLVQLTATRTNTVTLTTTISDPTGTVTSVRTSVSTTVSAFVLLTSTVTSLTEAPTCTGISNLNANAGAGGQGTVVNSNGLVTFQAGAPSSGGAVQLNGNVLSFAQARFVPRGQLQSFALNLTQASANGGCGNVITTTTNGTGLLSCSVSMANGDTITCTAPAPYNTGIFSSTFSVDPTTGNLRIGCAPAGVAATLRQECIASQADGSTCTLPGQCTSNYCNAAGICAVSPPSCSTNADCSQGSYCSYEFVCATQLKVVLLAAEAPNYTTDVRTKLSATNRFAIVDTIVASSTTPTLAQLLAYDAVLTWSDANYADGNALGNVLADYIDRSHRVVNAVFSVSNTGGLEISGRFATDGYAAFPPGYFVLSPRLTYLPVLRNDPLLAGVKSFDGGSRSFRVPGSSVSTNATLVATWSNGDRLVVKKPGVKGAGSVVGLNFWPVSSDVDGGAWVSSTDGAILLANALTNYS